jgi:predicted histone-like DNA-binding protein
MLGNPAHEDDPKKAYGKIQLTGVVSLSELSAHISEHNSVFSKGTILGILSELSGCIRELILQGYKIELGELGTLTPAITCKGAVTMADFTAQNITDLKVNFAKGSALLNLRRDAEFEKTTTRKAQAAALKAENEGLTNANWSEDENDGD